MAGRGGHGLGGCPPGHGRSGGPRARGADHRWPGPSVATWVPSAFLVLRGPGGCSPRRRLPGGASSRSRAVGRRRRGRHGQQARHGVGRRCPAGGVHPSGFGVRDPAVRPSGVGHLGSSSSGSGGRPSAVQPSGVQPSGVCLIRPDASGSSHSDGGGGDPGRAGRATLTTGTGGGPGGYRAVDGSIDGRGGRDAGDAAEVALVSGRSVADPGRRVGCGPRRPRLPAERPGGPGRRGERPWRAAARWARVQAAAQGGCTRPCGWRPRLGARPRWVVVAEADARVGGPGGTRGGADGDGRAAPARPKPAASAPGSLPAVL
jgi:hypothetical protein